MARMLRRAVQANGYYVGVALDIPSAWELSAAEKGSTVDAMRFAGLVDGSGCLTESGIRVACQLTS